MKPEIVALLPEQLAKLALWLRYEKSIDKLIASGALDLRAATVSVYLDPNGSITTISITDKRLYDSRSVDMGVNRVQ